MSNKKPRIISNLLGIAPAVDLAKTTVAVSAVPVAHLKDAGGATRKAVAESLKRLPKTPPTMTPEDKFWTFLNHFGKGPEDLPALRAQSRMAALIMATGAVAFLVLPFVAPLSEGIIMDAVKVMAPITMAAMAIKHVFANWIFRREAHGSFREFVKSRDWIPGN